MLLNEIFEKPWAKLESCNELRITLVAQCFVMTALSGTNSQLQ